MNTHCLYSAEVTALERRTRKVIRSGIIFLSAAALLTVAGCIALLISHGFHPRIDEFTLDVPRAYYPHPQNSAVLGDIFSTGMGWFSSGFSSLRIVYIVLFIASAGLALFRFILGDEFPLSIGQLFVAGLALIGPLWFFPMLMNDEAADAPAQKIEAFINEDNAVGLLKYLQDNGMTPEGKSTWDARYLTAQLGIKTGKPDPAVAAQVVDGYLKDSAANAVPVSVKYALEMTAFNRAVNPVARNYERGLLKKEHFFSGVSSSAFTCAIVLFMLGAILYGGGRNMKHRVVFLQNA